MNYPALRYVAETCTVQGAGRALLWAIAYRADNKTGECTAKLSRLAREAGMSYATAKRAKAGLLSCGEVEIIAGTGRPRGLRIIGPEGSRAQIEPQERAQIEPVDNALEGSNCDAKRLIVPPVEGSNRGSPYKEKKVRTIEGFEGSPATAASVDDDTTADAVVVHSPNGQATRPLDPGLSEATRTSLAAVKASIHDQLTADRQAERDRARDLLGPPATEPQETQ